MRFAQGIPGALSREGAAARSKPPHFEVVLLAKGHAGGVLRDAVRLMDLSRILLGFYEQIPSKS